ncbi:MAG: isoprenyl transferase [Elusimicrobia bacterium]|nr:isoprenyl transferase [Elusimicrobiota bacterium]
MVAALDQNLLRQIDRNKLPRHIAIIMDGNGRWAKQRGFPRIFGHRSGVTAIREIVSACGELGVRVLTLFAFSTENWLRPPSEVRALMRLLERYLQRELPALQQNNVRLHAIGHVDQLPSSARRALRRAIAATADNAGLILILALNYGGRQEILDAVQRCLAKGAKAIDEQALSRSLDTAGLPDPDLLIRTSGEMRFSNFLLWQIAYTELYVTDTLWPDFRRVDLYRAILGYQRRERRFGGI